MKLQILKGVVGFSITLLFLNTSVASKKQESHLDIIEKAQNLMLQKDRQRATQLLVQSIQKENPKSNAGKQLISVLNQISVVFLTDKAQQLYELALTAASTDRSLSLTRINEALRIENNHLLLLSVRARMHISQIECFEAKTITQNMNDLNPFYADLNLIFAQISACENKWGEYDLLRAKVDFKPNQVPLSWLVLDAEKLFQIKDYKKMSETLEQMTKFDKSYPETHFWFWKKLVAQQVLADLPARKYVNLCKNISEKKKRSYIFDPKLCSGIPEVEAYLQKNG